ncbi:MAG TPA: hypothetical protein PKV48_04990, partial [Thermodesulfobacteriota bacterium]|nr:hypothetical protein [Thermodesulfobacteriota bacterium]
KSILLNNEDRPKVLLVFSLLWLLIHTIGVRDCWIYLFSDGLAGIGMLGGYYQPSCFGFLLLAGIAAYVSRRLILAALCFVLAPVFHPTYLISSIAVAIAIIFLPANRSLEINWSKRLLFLSFVILVLIPYAIWCVKSLTSGDPLVQSKAHYLLSAIRIPHHTVPTKWNLWRTINFFLVGLIAAWLGRKWIIGQLLLVMLLVVGATVLWTIMGSHPTFAVVAPWRISVFLAPLSRVVIITTVATWSWQKIKTESPLSLGRWAKASVLVVTLACLAGVLHLVFDYQKKTKKPDYPIARFLANYHKPGNQYLVPLDLEKIRLEAGIPVFATWKSHPTKDSEFLEWYKRIETASTIYEKQADQAKAELLALVVNHSVTHVVWPQSKGDCPFSQMGQQVYRDKYFSLWDVRGASQN